MPRSEADGNLSLKMTVPGSGASIRSHRRVGLFPHAGHPLGREDDLVVGGLDVGRGQRRSVVETDARTQLESVGQPVRGDLPVGGHVADDLGVVVGIDLDQQAVERRHRLDLGEGALLVGVEAWRVRPDGGEEDAALPRGLGRRYRARDRAHQQRAHQDRHEGGEDHPITPDSCRHLFPPLDVSCRVPGAGSPAPGLRGWRTLPGSGRSCQPVRPVSWTHSADGRRVRRPWRQSSASQTSWSFWLVKWLGGAIQFFTLAQCTTLRDHQSPGM